MCSRVGDRRGGKSLATCESTIVSQLQTGT
jgi:hypothetical protein